MSDKYTIIRDTREHDDKGWLFATSRHCAGTEVSKLDTGDYSIKGMEDILCIERKGSTSEFARNITENRFEKELQRMREFKYSYIILEFNMSDLIDYPDGSGIPYNKRKFLKFRGPFVLKRIIELSLLYPTKILLCGDRGKEVASSIFKRVMEIEQA